MIEEELEEVLGFFDFVPDDMFGEGLVDV